MKVEISFISFNLWLLLTVDYQIEVISIKLTLFFDYLINKIEKKGKLMLIVI